MKRPLPKIRWTSRTNGSPALVEDWLAENNLRAMSAGEEDDTPVSARPDDVRDLSHLAAPFDPSPRVGEIRLLSAEFSSEPQRPVYVAILKHWADEGFVTAVFSSFSTPALSTELQFPARPHPLRTLCLWHHHVLPSEVLAESWLIDTLTESELRDAWQVFRHASTDEPLPSPLAQRVGTKITSESDPRIAYQLAEIALLEPLARAAELPAVETHEAPAPFPAKHSAPFFTQILDLSAWLALLTNAQATLSAASIGTSSHPENLELLVENPSATLAIYPSTKDASATLAVFDGSGEISTSLDGCQVISRSGEPISPPIANGMALCKIDAEALQGGISLIDPQNNTLALALKS